MNCYVRLTRCSNNTLRITVRTVPGWRRRCVDGRGAYTEGERRDGERRDAAQTPARTRCARAVDSEIN